MGLFALRTSTPMKNDSKEQKSRPSDNDVEAYFQLKKIKRFFGVHNSGVCDDESGPVSYGDGHAGWNR